MVRFETGVLDGYRCRVGGGPGNETQGEGGGSEQWAMGSHHEQSLNAIQ
jgi:hypothetical protein